MKRRQFIAGTMTIPALGAAIATAAALRDPHQGWLDTWRRLRAAWTAEGHDEQSEETPHGEELWGEIDVYENRLSATAATTIAGALAQLDWVLSDSLDTDFQRGHREALELVASTMRANIAEVMEAA